MSGCRGRQSPQGGARCDRTSGPPTENSRGDAGRAHRNPGCLPGSQGVAGTLGFRYALTDGQQWGAGFRFEFFGGTESFEWGRIVGGTIRLP